jgi:hypothetical protein
MARLSVNRGRREVDVHSQTPAHCAAAGTFGLLGSLPLRPRIQRVVSAIDCGTVVNPMTVERQVERATADALSAALYGEITVKDGRVAQSNFHDY